MKSGQVRGPEIMRSCNEAPSNWCLGLTGWLGTGGSGDAATARIIFVTTVDTHVLTISRHERSLRHPSGVQV